MAVIKSFMLVSAPVALKLLVLGMGTLAAAFGRDRPLWLMPGRPQRRVVTEGCYM